MDGFIIPIYTLRSAIPLLPKPKYKGLNTVPRAAYDFTEASPEQFDDHGTRVQQVAVSNREGGGHQPGKHGKVGQFESNQAKVRENVFLPVV